MGTATAQKRRMGIWTILAIATVLAVIIGLFIFFALYDPNGSNRPPTVPGDIVPTISPFPTTSFKPSLSPTITARPTIDIPLNRMCEGRDDQGNLNTGDMDKFLDEDVPFYFVELLLFRGGNNWENVGLTLYEKYFYPTFEEVLKDYNAEVKFVLTYGAQFGALSTSWNGALVTRFPDGDAFRSFLTDPRMAMNDVDDATVSRTPFEWRKQALEDSRSWATSLNSEPRVLFRNLQTNHTSDPIAQVSMIHAMMIKKNVPGLGTGKSLVRRFDETTENEKSEEIIRSQAWFQVEATCSGSGAPFQEIRIESAPDLNAYNQILQESKWIDAQRYRQMGIEEASFSTLAFPLLTTDLYEDSDNDGCADDVQRCDDIFPRVYASRDPETNCDFASCPCNDETRTCNGFRLPRVSGDSVGQNTCQYELCNKPLCSDDVKECTLPERDSSFHLDTYFVTRNPYDNCEFPQCRDNSCPSDFRDCGTDLGYVGRDISNNCDFFPCDLKKDECDKESPQTFRCDNGAIVERNPNNKCKFYSCPKTCDREDTKRCPDGTEVGRDPANDCDFLPCNTCSSELKKCPLGSEVMYVGRNPSDECNFFPCVDSCPRDKMVCPDGSEVGRDATRNCEFFPCPCEKDIKQCGGSLKTVTRNPDNNCLFFPCEKKCTLDVKECPNGNVVHRDPHNHCNFPTCAEKVCPDDERRCPDGTIQKRDVDNDCKFPPCIDRCNSQRHECADGTFVFRDRKNYCRFAPCYSEICNKDRRRCPNNNNIHVARNPEENCDYSSLDEDCDKVCEQDIKWCPGGQGLFRNPNNNCQHDSCNDTSNSNCGGGTRDCANGATISSNDNCNTKCAATFTCQPDVRECNDGSVRMRDPFNGCNFKNC